MKHLRRLAPLCVLAFIASAGCCAHHTSLKIEEENTQRILKTEPVVVPSDPDGTTSSEEDSDTLIDGVETEISKEERVIKRETVP